MAGGRVSGQHAAAQGRQGESGRRPSGFHRQRPVILVNSIFVFIFVQNFRLARDIAKIRSRVFTKNFLKILKHFFKL